MTKEVQEVPSCRESEGVTQIIVIIVASLPRSPADTRQSHAPPHTLARDLWLESTPFVPQSWGKNKHEIEGHPQTPGSILLHHHGVGERQPSGPPIMGEE